MWIHQTVVLVNFALSYVHFASCTDTYTICNTAACKRTANRLLGTINPSVKPCDDIYQYVCGKFPNKWSVWKDSPLIPGTTKPNTEKIYRANLHNILSRRSEQNDGIEIKFAKHLYKKCLDVDNRKKDGLTSLIQHVKRIGEWPLLTPDSNVTGKWQDIYKKIDRYFTTASLYNVKITGHDDKYALLLTAPNTFLPYEKDPLAKKYTAKVKSRLNKQFIHSVAGKLARTMNLSIDATKLKTEVDDIINFERKILQARIPPRAELNSTGNRRFLTIGECQKLYNGVKAVGNGKINWLEMIENKFDVKSDSKIVVLEWHYFSQLGAILDETRIRTIVNYIVWHFIRSLLPYTTHSMQKLIQIAEENGEGDNEKRQKKLCLRAPNLKYAVDYEYVKTYFNENRKEKVLNILHDVTSATRKNVQQATWMDTATKTSFNNKVDSMVLQVGYPDWYSDVAIRNYYRNLDRSAFNLTFLDSVLKVIKIDFDHNKEKLGQRVNPHDWYFTSYQYSLSAEYTSKYATKGYLRMPAAVFSDLIYHPENPTVMSYATVGYELGYDLTTAYGFLYDLIYDSDQMTDQFPPANQNLYRKMKRCFKDYYYKDVTKAAKTRFSRADEVPFVRSVIDSAVISSLWRAWMIHKHAIHNHTVDVRLPKLTHLTNDQLFFIAIVYNTCSSTMNGHPDLKMWSTFAHSPAFHNAFGCKPPSYANPAEMCNVWS